MENEREGEKLSIAKSNSKSIETSLIPWEITEATEDIPKGFKNMILRLRNQDNALIIARFILAMKNEINLFDKIDSKFCVKCRMKLSYDIYLETVQKQENENSYIKEMQKQIDEIYAKIKENDLKNK